MPKTNSKRGRGSAGAAKNGASVTTTTDLYDELGVDKKASKDEIKRAYRRRARETHPDSGGSQEQFARVHRAYSILTDDRKRKDYDETGTEAGEGLNNEYAEAASAILTIVTKILDEAMEKGLDLEGFDFNGSIKSALARQLQDLKKTQLAISKDRNNVKKLMDKLTVKNGEPNIFARDLQKRYADRTRMMDEIASSIKAQEKAKEMMLNYYFDIGQAMKGWTSATSATTTNVFQWSTGNTGS